MTWFRFICQKSENTGSYHVVCIICSAGLNDVVDLHEAADSLCGKSDGAGGHKEWLHHVLVKDICDLGLQ